MEQLPVDIEQKLEKLPVIAFDANQEFQDVIFSQDFTDIFNYYKERYLPDVLKTKPELYQRISLYMNLTNQDSSFLEQTDQVLYRRHCPSIEEFLSNNYYHGRLAGTMYPYWKNQLYDIFKVGSPVRKTIFSGAIGTGKALRNSEILPTPNGNKRVADIKPGDLLWGKNGKPTTVLMIHPQGKVDLYEVCFSDGTSTFCCENHQWQVYGRGTKYKNKVLSVKDLLKRSLLVNSGKAPGYNFQIPFCEPIEFEEKSYEIHPYVLGVILGDGCCNKSVIDIANNQKDAYILDKVAKLLPSQYELHKRSLDCDHYIIAQKKTNEKDSFIKKIKKLGLYLTSQYKFIPVEYKNGSISQRLDLLRGLMDTDGCCKIRNNGKSSNCIFGTISEKLAKDVADIVRSLGGRAKISKYQRNNRKAEYNVYINLLLNPFALPRKANKFIPHLFTKSIVNIKKTNLREEATCFTVDARDHLFLCNDYIVTHNSTIARKAVVYVLYRLLCLRYPRAVFNVDADSTLANFILSVTLKQVYDTNLLPFIKLLEGMPCFQRVMSVKAFDNFDLNQDNCPVPFVVEKSTDTVFFPDNIILTAGSQISHTVGYNIVNSFCDEINEKGVEYALEFLNSIDSRFSSRFQGSDLVFQSIVSSARTTNSPVGEYIRRLPKNDPSIRILNPMLWQVKEDPAFLGDGSTFPVMVGNGSIPSKIITDPGELQAIEDGTYTPPTGCELIHVPTVYQSKFELQLDQSIQDIAGMTTSDNNAVFRDTTLLQDDSLTPEIILEANLKDNTDLLECLPQGIFEKNLQGKWQFCRDPLTERYVHLDLSGGGDGGQCDSGICVLHKEWQLNPMTNQKDTIYVVDLLIAVNAKNKIDLQAIQNFMINLVTERNIKIHTVSADQYQSLILLQALEASGCFTKVEKVSVDTKPEPYLNASRLIESGMVKIGTCPKLIKELEALIWQKGKVTRTTELKDLCDALTGAIYNAQLNYTDQPQTMYTSAKTQEKAFEYTDFIDTNSQELADI